jgi:hypothetical protein
VVKLVYTLQIQISVDRRYLVDLHEQVRMGRSYDMQLVIVELGQ